MAGLGLAGGAALFHARGDEQQPQPTDSPHYNYVPKVFQIKIRE